MSLYNSTRVSLVDLRNEIVGLDTMVPVLDGSRQRYVFLDNAASTPTFRSVTTCIENVTHWYSEVHRGTELKEEQLYTPIDREYLREVHRTFHPRG